MSKQLLIAIFTLPIISHTSSGWGMDDLDRFNGMQLAYVKLPAEGSEKKPVKPKPKQPAKPAKPATAPVAAPPAATVPKAAPPTPVAPAPAVKSVTPAPTPVVKPAPAPLVRPAPAPLVKPAPVVEKPAEPVRKPKRRVGKQVETEWQFGMGVEIGGEELGTVTYSDGSTASVKANTGILLGFGALIPNDDDGSFWTQLGLGYKTGGPRLWSSDVNWSAIPLEAIEFYRSSGMRMGLGVSYHLNPQLKVNVSNTSQAMKFNNALGFIVQAGWQPAGSGYSIDLRYTRISFQPSDGAPAVDGSVGGAYMNFLF